MITPIHHVYCGTWDVIIVDHDDTIECVAFWEKTSKRSIVEILGEFLKHIVLTLIQSCQIQAYHATCWYGFSLFSHCVTGKAAIFKGALTQWRHNDIILPKVNTVVRWNDNVHNGHFTLPDKCQELSRSSNTDWHHTNIRKKLLFLEPWTAQPRSPQKSTFAKFRYMYVQEFET